MQNVTTCEMLLRASEKDITSLQKTQNLLVIILVFLSFMCCGGGLAVLSQHHEHGDEVRREVKRKKEGRIARSRERQITNLSKDNVLHIVASHKAQGVLSQAKKFRSIHDKRLEENKSAAMRRLEMRINRRNSRLPSQLRVKVGENQHIEKKKLRVAVLALRLKGSAAQTFAVSSKNGNNNNNSNNERGKGKDEERRYDNGHGPFTLQEFIEHYGEQQGLEVWKESPQNQCS